MARGGPSRSGGQSQRFEPDALAGLPAEVALARLPAGRHGLPREFIAGNQRLRIVAGMLRSLPEHGYPAITIAHITAEAGVSRAAFYQQFSGKEECFLATHEIAGDWLCERVERAVAEEVEWPARVRGGASEALRLLASNPPVAHLMAVEALQAGPAARERHQACLDRFAAALRGGHSGWPGLPDDLADLLLSGIVSLIAKYIDTGRAEQLPEATTALVEGLLIPYLAGEKAGAARLPETG